MDSELSLKELLKVLRIYSKEMRRRDSFVNFRAYVYYQVRSRTTVVTEKRCTISNTWQMEVKSTYSCSHCHKQAYTFFECPHITCVKVRKALNGQALIPSMPRLAKDIMYEDTRRKIGKMNSSYCPPIFRYQSCFSKANRCIIRKTVSQSSRSAVKKFSPELLPGTIEELKGHCSTTKRIKEKNNKKRRIAYASNRITSKVEKKKRGRGRPRKSEQKKNCKVKKLIEEAEANQVDPRPT